MSTRRGVLGSKSIHPHEVEQQHVGVRGGGQLRVVVVSGGRVRGRGPVRAGGCHAARRHGAHQPPQDVRARPAPARRLYVVLP